MNLDNVKVGDIVMVELGCYGEHLGEVTKVTKTLVVIGNYKFNKKGDVVPYDTWSTVHCSVPSQEDIDRIRSNGQVCDLSKKLTSLTSAFKPNYAKYSKSIYEKIRELNELMDVELKGKRI